MRHVFLGKTGIKVSKLALGTMTFGGDTDAASAAAMFHRCREVGINHFDTADVYNQGRAEEILGGLVRSCREEVVLATKAYFPTSPDPNARGSSRHHLVRGLEASLRRLGTDRVELFYLHRFDDRTDLEETLRALEHLQLRGMIVHAAVSNFAAWQTAKALGIAAQHGWAKIAATQPMYNLAKRQVEVEILPMAESEGLAVFPYSPLGGGLFSGKYGAGDRAESGRLASWAIYKERYGATSNYEIADRFRTFARDRGHHPVSLAVAWVMSHPAVTAPIVGARDVTQLDPSLGALEIDMTAELRAEISALSPAPPPATDRNEEGKVTTLGTR